MKRFLVLCISLTLAVSIPAAVGCNKKDQTKNRLIEITVADGDTDLWTALRDDFNEASDGEFTAEISVAQNPESVLEYSFNNGNAPDLVLLPTGRGVGFTEDLIRSRAIVNLDELLDRNVYGEETKLRDKFLSGFLSTGATNPYQSELSPETSSYMLPVFFEPYGLFYNKELMTADGAAEGTFKLPDAWDGYLNLRPSVTAKNAGAEDSDKLYMYGYISAQDNEAIIAPTVASYGGLTLAERMLNYDYIYENTDFASALTTFGEINSLLSTGETESGLGNYVLSENAAQALVDEKLMFLAGGADVMEQLKVLENFDFSKIGFTAAFAANDSSQRYAMTDMEQIFIPQQAENREGAEEFLLYLYSDRAAEIMLKEGGRVLPTKYALENAGGYVDKGLMLLINVFADGSVHPCFGQEAVIDADVLATLEASWSTVYANGFTSSVLLGRNTQVWTDNLKHDSVILRSALLGN